MNWYAYYIRKKELIWEILKFVRYREAAWIAVDKKAASKRFLTIIKYGFLLRSMKIRYNRETLPKYHFFASIELVKKFDENKKPLDLREVWKPFGWDLVFDIDSEGEDRIKKSYKIAKNLIDFLDKNNIDFRIQFSGSKGFHIFIPWNWLKRHGWKARDYGKFNRYIAEIIWNNTGISTDASTFSVKRDLIRVPFSIHPTSGLLCYPLTIEQFDDFDVDMAYPLNINSEEERDKLEKSFVCHEYEKDNILSKSKVIEVVKG